MKTNYLSFFIFLRVALIATSGILCAFFAFKNYWYSFTFFAVITLIILIEFIYYIQNHLSYNQKIVSALLYDDFSLNIDDNPITKNKNIVKLYNKTKNLHLLNTSKEILYHQLLNAVPSSFLILKEEENNRKIVFMNLSFQQLFDVPKSSSWSYLKKFIPEFCQTLENSNFKEQKKTIEIQIQNQEKQTYVIQTSKTIIANETYNVIFLDSIQRVIEATEKEAWLNIMQVISHEIINSLTPIHSLAHSTKLYFENDTIEQEDIEDIRLSLDTIMNRSKHLQTFVEQYRVLTSLPYPNKRKQNLSEIINHIESIFKNTFQTENITFSTNIPKHLMLDLDRGQFEQVLINLIKNAIHSVAESNEKTIEITTKQTENRLQIHIQDSGALIDTDIISKIFLPFYTTRKNGAGIGLTLSKNIIEAHHGYLYFQQNENTKKFVIVFSV